MLIVRQFGMRSVDRFTTYMAAWYCFHGILNVISTNIQIMLGSMVMTFFNSNDAN
jgi:hypothetical protein